MVDMTAKTCATALLRHWVARYGVPESIVTDRGRQFTSDLWMELSRSLGISRKMTTSYHPQSNGMIERQHRTLKDRLIARACASGSTSWMENLPFVLLGIRTSVRADSSCSPSDLLYGASLRLPGDLLGAAGDMDDTPASDFASRLRHVMRQSSPMPVVHHGLPPSRVDGALMSASHVFLRVDAVRRPLVPPYEGPYLVLERSPKTFVILKREKPVTVTVDRLKPAILLPEAVSPSAARPPPDVAVPVPQSQPSPAAPSPLPALDPSVWPLPTRYGRRPRPPSRLNL